MMSLSKASVITAGRHFLRANYRVAPQARRLGRRPRGGQPRRIPPLADLADATGLTGAFADALRKLRPRGTGHDPGRVAVDLAVMLADGGEAISDLALLRDQAEMFGPVASTATAWRLLAGIGPATIARLRSARAAARDVAWLQAAETQGGILAARAGGRDLPGLVLDLDATLVTCHSEKEQAAPTYKRGFGYHPLLCFLDTSPAFGGETPTGEALAGLLRPGNAGANTAADHITVLAGHSSLIGNSERHRQHETAQTPASPRGRGESQAEYRPDHESAQAHPVEPRHDFLLRRGRILVSPRHSAGPVPTARHGGG